MASEVEIARYPVRCRACGRRDEVRVVLDPGVGAELADGTGRMPTWRVGPEGWRWVMTGGALLWECPECAEGTDDARA